MEVIINNNPIKAKSDFSFMQVRRSNKNHKNEYIINSYIFTDKPLNEYEKKKISEWITRRINND